MGVSDDGIYVSFGDAFVGGSTGGQMFGAVGVWGVAIREAVG